MDSNVTWSDAAKLITQGEIGVLPTDTIYGIVGSAMRPSVVERIYQLRRRELDKPLITLISGVEELELFEVKLDDKTRVILDKVWPGPVSVIVSVTTPAHQHIHRGTDSIAFRIPNKAELRDLLKVTGPIVAPSANLAGEPSAATVEEARQWFGQEVFYLDEGERRAPASALVDMRDLKPRVLRPAPGFNVSDLL